MGQGSRAALTTWRGMLRYTERSRDERPRRGQQLYQRMPLRRRCICDVAQLAHPSVHNVLQRLGAQAHPVRDTIELLINFPVEGEAKSTVKILAELTRHLPNNRDIVSSNNVQAKGHLKRIKSNASCDTREECT